MAPFPLAGFMTAAIIVATAILVKTRLCGRIGDILSPEP